MYFYATITYDEPNQTVTGYAGTVINYSTAYYYETVVSGTLTKERQLPIQRSEIPFCQGAWTLVRFGVRPVAFRNAMTSASNFASRSRMT